MVYPLNERRLQFSLRRLFACVTLIGVAIGAAVHMRRSPDDSFVCAYVALCAASTAWALMRGGVRGALWAVGITTGIFVALTTVIVIAVSSQ